MKKFLLCFSLLALCLGAYAVPAKPGAVTVIQGDGSELTIRLYGDEFFHYTTTDDGYQVVQRNDGNYYYHAPSTTRTNIMIQAHNLGNRTASERAFLGTITTGVDPSFTAQAQNQAMVTRQFMDIDKPVRSFVFNGTTATKAAGELPPTGLVIVVQYANVLLNEGRTLAEFSSMLNDDGYSAHGGTGSARDYFIASSKGKYSPTFVVCPQVITLPHNRAYYGGNDASGNDLRPREMIADACRGADPYVNFADYDYNNDGKVDNVFVFYAGHNEAEHAPAEAIWPHRWVVANETVVLDGVRIYDYACTSELRGSVGTTLAGIGTFAHEFGHVLGLPDFYDTDNAGSGGTSPGLYQIAIMAGGSYNNNGCTPPYYSAIERNMVGWNNLKQLVASDSTYTINSIDIDNDAYYIPATDPKEFYIIEARDGSKGWDQYMRASGGMLIYKVDMSPNHIIFGTYTAANMWSMGKVNAAPEKECAKLIEAGGYNVSTTLNQNALFYPGSGRVTAFGPSSYGGRDNDGKPVSIKLENISYAAGAVTFNAVSTSSNILYSTIKIKSGGYSTGDDFTASIANTPKDATSVSWVIDDAQVANGAVVKLVRAGKVGIVCKVKYSDGSEEVITRFVTVK